MPRFNTLAFAGLLIALSGAQLAPAQTTAVARLAVQTGNGQVACLCLNDTLTSFQPISVKATDVNNNPVAGATVTWTVTSGQMTVANPTTVTGGDGVSVNPINLVVIDNFTSSVKPFLFATVQAVSNNNSVTFSETQSLLTTQGLSVVQANSPTFNGSDLTQATLSANVASTLSTPIQVAVRGLGVANTGGNVSVNIVNAQVSPSMTCAYYGGYADPGGVLTDTNGNASCYPVFNGSGTGTYYITVGGVPSSDINSALYLQSFGPFTFTSVPGAPAAMQIVSGNNQVGATGQALSPLVARLVDANGYPVQNQTVVWTIAPLGAATLNSVQTVTDNNGQVSAAAAVYVPAQTGALITVALQGNANIAASFQETLVGAITTLTKISGDGQNGQMGANFPAPLIVQVNSSNGPVKNYPIQFLTNGPISLAGGNTVFTDATGEVSLTVRAGSSIGPATVTAIAGVLNQVFKLTVTISVNAPPPNGMTKVGSDPAPAVVNTRFTTPLVVQVNNTAGPVQGYLVNFSSTGPVNLLSGAATTDTNGRAQVSVQAGTIPGAAVVTAAIAGYTVTFNLTVIPTGPSLTANSFLNAASRQVGGISPCSLATISAPGLTPDGIADLAPAPLFGRLPLSVHNLSVIFGNYAAPIVNVAQGSANPEVTIQVPCEVQPASAVQVTVNVGAGTGTANVAVQSVSPGIFETVMSDGAKRAVVVRDDGSFVDIGGAVSNPARRGENARIYVTGVGLAIPAMNTNAILNPEADLQNVATVAGIVTVGISGASGVQVVSARPAPDLIGVYEIKIVLPSNATPGNDLLLSVGIIPQGGSSSSTPIYANSKIPIL